jgi:cytochrome P450
VIELLKQLLISPSTWQKYDRALNERVPMRIFLGDRGLLMIQNGEEWHAKRTMLAAAFSRNAMKHVQSTIVQQRVRIMCDRLASMQNKYIDMQEEFQRMTFDVAALFALGVDVDSQRKQESSAFYAAWKACIEYTYWHVVLFFSMFYYICSLPSPWRKRFEEAKDVLESMSSSFYHCSN